MRGPEPRVTVGLPVHNCGRHLGQAIESLLGQTFGDFELVISDNASTDGTEELCRRYAGLDGRIRFIRQPRNIGAPRNWNAVLREARGAYFKWASGSDYCAPSLLERCVGALDRDRGAVLCAGRTGLVGEDGQSLGVYRGDLGLGEARPSDRYARVRRELGLNNPQQAVVRTRVLRRTGADRLYPGGDMALTAELALYGRFILLEDVLLYRRQTVATFMSMRSPAEVQRIYDPDARRPFRLLRGRLHWDHLVSVLRAPIPLEERGRALACALRLAGLDRGRLLEEIRSLFNPAWTAG